MKLINEIVSHAKNVLGRKRKKNQEIVFNFLA